MSDYTELIQRLRDADPARHRDMLHRAAAFALEAQARELEALRADAERLNKELIECRQNQ